MVVARRAFNNIFCFEYYYFAVAIDIIYQTLLYKQLQSYWRLNQSMQDQFSLELLYFCTIKIRRQMYLSFQIIKDGSTVKLL